MTMYLSSKGEVRIEIMLYSHALNALKKLQRTEPDRTDEIAAIAEHIAKLDAAQAEKNRAGIGGNNPPEETPVVSPTAPTSAPVVLAWDAVKLNMDDLLTEAASWADGVAIVNQDQADAVGKLRQLLQGAANVADETRVAEKAPLDKQIAEIQDRYNAYIAPMKNKAPGSVSKSVSALNNLLTVWLNKLDADRRAREDEARARAAEVSAAAIAARKEITTSTDLTAIDEATDMLDQAKAAFKDLRSVEREKVQVKTDGRAISLRSFWTAKLVDGQGGTALKHYAQSHPDRVKSFLQMMADEDVKSGIRAIPGFTITEEKRV